VSRPHTAIVIVSRVAGRGCGGWLTRPAGRGRAAPAAAGLVPRLEGEQVQLAIEGRRTPPRPGGAGARRRRTEAPPPPRIPARPRVTSPTSTVAAGTETMGNRHRQRIRSSPTFHRCGRTGAAQPASQAKIHGSIAQPLPEADPSRTGHCLPTRLPRLPPGVSPMYDRDPDPPVSGAPRTPRYASRVGATRMTSKRCITAATCAVTLTSASYRM
jgi:hypothetical protein